MFRQNKLSMVGNFQKYNLIAILTANAYFQRDFFPQTF